MVIQYDKKYGSLSIQIPFTEIFKEFIRHNCWRKRICSSSRPQVFYKLVVLNFLAKFKRKHQYSGLEVSFEKSKETKNKYNNKFSLFFLFFFFFIMTSFLVFFYFFIFLLLFIFFFLSFFFYFFEIRRSGLAVSKVY